MVSLVSNSQHPVSRNFGLIKDSMLQSEALPLAEVLDDNKWQEIFDTHEIDFGSEEESVYTPAITLWALISQVFFKGEMRSCKAVVGRVASLGAMPGKTVCSTNTGAYCRARSKISWQAIRDICCQISEATETAFDAENVDPDLDRHDVVAEVQATPTSGRILLFDGFTITAAAPPRKPREVSSKPLAKIRAWFSDYSRRQFDLDGNRLVSRP